jgi:transcriptional regulator with XRE-family HTH domain
MTDLTHLTTHGEVLAAEMTDRAFGEEWQRLAVARAVAATVIAYRSDHELSQRELATQLGWRQPQIARIEGGEVNPTHETLMRLASGLGVEFTISITAEGREPTQLTAAARERVIATYAHERSSLRLTATP